MTSAFLFFAACFALEGAPLPETAPEAIRRGDRLADDGRYQEAIDLYLEVLPHNEEEVLWRISQAFSDMGEAAPRDRQKELNERAVEYGRRAVKEAAGRASSHAALAAALGRKALFSGGREKVRLSKEVKEEAEKAMALDPRHFAPYLVLGIWNREIAGLGIVLRAAARVFYGGLPHASYENSLEMLEHAIALNPDSSRAHYELGLTLREMGKREEARREFRKVLELPRTRALDDKVKADARAELKKGE